MIKEMSRSMYTLDYKELGKRIRAERRKQDLTQEQLAEMADISDSFMGHIERGGRTLSIETLVKLANALHLSVEYIVCGEFNYQPNMLPAEIHDALNRMSGSQRKVFLDMLKTLAAHSDMWPV
jgi:transcriptional regulator with XRE-family HTH domain